MDYIDNKKLEKAIQNQDHNEIYTCLSDNKFKYDVAEHYSIFYQYSSCLENSSDNKLIENTVLLINKIAESKDKHHKIIFLTEILFNAINNLSDQMEAVVENILFNKNFGLSLNNVAYMQVRKKELTNYLLNKPTIVKSLMSSKEHTELADKFKKEFCNQLLNEAIKFGKIDVIDLILPTILKEKNKTSDRQKLLNDLLLSACLDGQHCIAVMDYLLNSKNLTHHANTQFLESICLRQLAHRQDNLEEIKFLLESDKVKDKPNVHAKNDMLFEILLNRQDKKALDYLIYDYKIEKTNNINVMLKHYPLGQEIEKNFYVRDLQTSLDKKETKNINKHKL